MAENKRLKNVIFWMISQEIVESQEDLAAKLGYNSSSLSQIVTGTKPLSKKFAQKIVEFCSKINLDYLFGEADMLKDSAIVNFENYSVSQFKQRGYAPYYSLLKVSAGQYDLATIGQNEEPDSWIKFPELTVDAWFPIIGFSMEPKIYAGDTIGVVAVNNWEKIDPDKIYMIITIHDRMIKYLQYDESTPDLLWAISGNNIRFKVYKHEILSIHRVVFAGRLV